MFVIQLQLFLDLLKADESLTSCIALSFAFNGLIDLKLIPERSYITWYVLLIAAVKLTVLCHSFLRMTMAFSYGLLFYAYFSGAANTL